MAIQSEWLFHPSTPQHHLLKLYILLSSHSNLVKNVPVCHFFKMEQHVQERSSLHDYGSEKSSTLKSDVSETSEENIESQIPEKDLSTFRLVLILAALWVCHRQFHLPLISI